MNAGVPGFGLVMAFNTTFLSEMEEAVLDAETVLYIRFYINKREDSSRKSE